MDSIKTKVNKLIEYGKNQLQSKGVDSTASDLRGVLDGISDIQQGGGGDLLKSVCEGTVVDFTNSEVTRIRAYLFQYVSNLENVNMPNVTFVGMYAFRNCTNLLTVNIDSIVHRIDDYAFQNCTNLLTVNMPNAIGFGNGAFISCTKLTKVNARNIEWFGRSTFDSCTSLSVLDMRYASKIPSVPNVNCFNNVPTTCKFIIPDSLYDSWIASTNWVSLYNKGYQFVKVSEYYGTEGLTYTLNEDGESYTCSGVGTATDTVISIGQVYDDKPVTVIGNNAFLSYNLTNVNIPNSIKSIEYQAFSNCPNLVSVIIPDSVTSIGIRAFSVCSSLESATIGNSVTSIGQYAFSNCSSLTSITIPNSVNSIGSSAFWQCSSLTSITIPNSVTSIGEYAFYYCTSLTSITIPNSVTSIGSYTFDGCNSLTSITIPNSVTSIGDRAFNECTALQVVDFRSATQVPTIQSDSFRNVLTTCKFVIPDELYDSWITATNWSAMYASGYQFIKASEYTEA